MGQNVPLPCLRPTKFLYAVFKKIAFSGILTIAPSCFMVACMENTNSFDGWISTKEAVALSGLSQSRVMQHIRSGRLPSKFVAGRHFVREEDVRRLKVFGRSGRPYNEDLGRPVSEKLRKDREWRQARREKTA